MSKAEEFIKAKTRIGSNTTKGWRRNGVSIPSYSLPWLTPDDARKAVEREVFFEEWGHLVVKVDDMGVKSGENVKVLILKEE